MRIGRIANRGAPVFLFAFQDIITCLSGIMILLVLLLALGVTFVKEATGVPAIRDQKIASDEMAQKIATRHAEIQLVLTMLDSLQQGVPPERVYDPVKVSGELIQLASLGKVLYTKRALLEGSVLATQKETRQRQQQQAEREREIEALAVEKMALQQKLATLAKRKMVTYLPQEEAPKEALLVECARQTIRVGPLRGQEKPSLFASDDSGFDRFMAYTLGRSKSEEYFVFLIKPSAADYALQLAYRVKQAGFDMGYDALEENRHVAYGDIR